MARFTYEQIRDGERPVGSICNPGELELLVDEAKTEGTKIPIYYVGQLGCISTFYITKNSKVGVEDCGTFFFHYIKYEITPGVFDQFSLLDTNVLRRNNYNQHFLFTNKMHAENYSQLLKNSSQHQKEVKEHQEWCNNLWKDFDDY